MQLSSKRLTKLHDLSNETHQCPWNSSCELGAVANGLIKEQCMKILPWGKGIY